MTHLQKSLELDWDVTSCTLRLAGTATPNEAPKLRVALQEAFDATSELVHVDLARLAVLDTSCLQLLWAASRQGRVVRLEAVPAPVLEFFSEIGVPLATNEGSLS